MKLPSKKGVLWTLYLEATGINCTELEWIQIFSHRLVEKEVIEHWRPGGGLGVGKEVIERWRPGGGLESTHPLKKAQQLIGVAYNNSFIIIIIQLHIIWNDSMFDWHLFN